MKYSRKEKFIAWVYKYIFRIQSPSAAWYGYKYKWDLIKRREADR